MRRLLWIVALLVLLAGIGAEGSVGFSLGFVARSPGRIVLELLGKPVAGFVFRVGCGEQFTVAINAVNMTKIAGFQMELGFTKRMLEVLSVDYANLDFTDRWASAYNMEPAVDNPGGWVSKIASVRIDGGLTSGTGRLLAVNFRALRPGICKIGLQRVLTSDSEGRQTSIRVCDVTMIIEKWPPWDVNRDGRVDVSDLVYVARWYGVRPWTVFSRDADVNRDGVVNLLDLILVAKHFGEVYSTSVEQMAPRKKILILDLQERAILFELERALLDGNAEELVVQAVGDILRRARSDVELTTWGRLRKGE